MSFSRRSSLPGIPSLFSNSPSLPLPEPPVRPSSSPPIPFRPLNVESSEPSTIGSPDSFEAISPSLTIRPRARRFSSSATLHAPPEPIPISPTSFLPGASYLEQRQSNLKWALRHNDTELIRTERAAIDRYKQELVERFGLTLEVSASSDGTGSIESFEIPIRDTSQLPSSSNVVRYGTGRRMSCLASYTGFPLPPRCGPTSYEVALDGGGGGGGGGYLYAPIDEPPSLSSLSSSRRSSAPANSRRRASSPYRPSGVVAPLSAFVDSRTSIRAHPAVSSSPSTSSTPQLERSSPSDEEEEGNGRAGTALTFHSPSPSRPPPLTPPTRVIHGFHIDSSSSRSPSPPPAQTILPPEPSPSHAICRGRAGSASFVSGLGCGNRQQERMELQASRDIEVLDREAERREKRGAGKRESSKEGVSRVRGGRTKDGKVAAAERLRKGYSGEYQL